MKRLFLGLGLFALLGAATVQADIVTRRSVAKRESGTLTITKDAVTVKPTAGAAVEIPSNDIVQIDYTGAPPGYSVARAGDAGGRLQQAIEGYQKALTDYKGDNADFKVEVQYFIARATAKIGLADPSKVDDGIKQLDDFISKNSNSYHLYPAYRLLGELALAKKDFAKAQTAFDKLGEAPFNEYKMAAKISQARKSLLEGNTAAAQLAFEAVAQMTPAGPQEASQVQEARLGVAKCMQQQNEHEKAIALLEQVILESAPEDTRVQAEAYVRQGDALQAVGKPKDALLAYLHVDLLFIGETDLHAEALYHLARLWATIQQPERASDAEDRLTNDYKNSIWAQKLKGDTAGG